MNIISNAPALVSCGTSEVLEHLSSRDLPLFLNELLRVGKGRMIHMICVKDRGKIVRVDPTHRIIKTESWWKKNLQVLKRVTFLFLNKLKKVIQTLSIIK